MKVLIATEGSEFSKKALERFCELFGNIGGVEARLISVVQPTVVPTEPFAVSAEYIRELDDAAKKSAHEVVEAARTDLTTMAPSVGDVTTVVGVGSPERVIVEEAEEWGADLIVTGSHGHGFWKRAWLGSVSNGVVHHAPCSVLIVRPEPE
ncbi:MAG: universal stress protein [Chloracidobacterium sp.]|nr:universal stress protein [Chloracidobacterium sp.]